MSDAIDLALPLVQHFESCRLDAYPDPGTGGKPWTIGWGHTGGVNPGDAISKAEADRLLVIDLSAAEASVLAEVNPLQLPDCQVAALISFIFNLGPMALRHSTLGVRIRAGDSGASEEFAKWNRAGGKVLAGLTKRRAAEASLFQGKEWRDD